MTDRPLLITGAFRSGTTLASHIFKNHSQIHMVYDALHYLRFGHSQYADCDVASSYSMIVEEASTRLKERLAIHIPKEIVIQEILDAPKPTHGVVYNALMRSMLPRDDHRDWGEKTNLVWSKIPAFFQMFPHGRVLHMIRNPLDVLYSWKKFTFSEGDAYLDGTFNCTHSMACASKYKNQFGKFCYYALRFEDLVENTTKTLGEVCNKFDLEYEKEMENATSFSDHRGEAWKGNSAFKESFTAISNSSIGNGINGLSQQDLSFITKYAGPLMKEWDYSYPSISLSSSEEDLLERRIQNNPLLQSGINAFSKNQMGVERYPQDPRLKENWSETRIPNFSRK